MSQQFIPGTEPPGLDPKIEQAIEDKYARLAKLKIAREAVSVADARLLELVEKRGAPYPFLEPSTGKRKVLRLDAEKKLKTVASKSPKQQQADRERERQQAEQRGGDQQTSGREAWEAEVKRRRSTVSSGPSMETVPGDYGDPFAATRAAAESEP